MSGTKIKALNTLAKITAGLQKKGKRIAFTNGCFDLLHFGHAMYLEKAKKCADYLVVGVNSDSSVKRIKGKNRPVVDEENRARLIASLASVDFVTIFNEDTPINVIKKIKPDVLVKGADWKKTDIVGAPFVESYGGKVTTVRLAKGLSSTNLIKKIIGISRR